MINKKKVSILFLTIIVTGCSGELGSEITAPVYGECLKYFDKYNRKMTTSYDVNLEIEFFNVEQEIKGGVVGINRISGRDSQLYFNGLKYLCYPNDYYTITLTDQAIQDVIRMSKGFDREDKEYYIKLNNKTISIQYNGIEEHLKSDVFE